MITAEQREKIKTVVGNYYVARVNAVLVQRGVVNRENQPHKKNMISMVMNGDRENPAIEDAIWTVYRAEIEKQQNFDNKKAQAAT